MNGSKLHGILEEVKHKREELGWEFGYKIVD